MFANKEIWGRGTAEEIVKIGKQLIHDNDNPKPITKEYVITEQVLEPVMTFLSKIDIPVAQMMAMGLKALPELEDYLMSESDEEEN